MTLADLKGLAEKPEAVDELLRLLVEEKDGEPVLNEEALAEILVLILKALPGRANAS